MSVKAFRDVYRKYFRRDKSSTLDDTEILPVYLGGTDIPDPANIFTKKLTKYVTPTTVQKHAIPVIIAGRDLMACATSGSGKSGAFIIPIVHLVKQGTRSKSFGSIVYPVALILCPTVERAEKVFKEVKRLCDNTFVKVFSGERLANYKPYNKSIDIDILVATPRQVQYILNAPETVKKARISLLNVEYLALDEADQLLQEFHMDTQLIIKHTDMHSIRQTMAFSNTFTRELQSLVYEFLKSDYIFFCEGEYGSDKITFKDIRAAEDNSNDIEYAYQQTSFSGFKDLVNDDNVWED